MLALIIILLSGCAGISAADTVYFIDDGFLSYPLALAQMLPGYALERVGDMVFYHLESGFVTEVFSPQAAAALRTGVAEYWYPQYLATVVIAADRDQTDTVIKGWSDLAGISDVVGFMDAHTSREMQIAAISYALEGESFTLTRSLDLLASLEDKNKLVLNSIDTPVFICFDHQAAEMIKNGRNIEIILPVEGTLTYERGLLSNTPLAFAMDPDELLLTAGFRLPDGSYDAAIYPDATAYARAIAITDYQHFNNTIIDVGRDYRRDVIGIRLYSGADGREHQLLALIYIVIIAVWIVLIINRATQRGVRYATMITGTILLCWIIVRLVKYQVPVDSTLNRYLWYGFYPFQLSLPLVILWMAWVIDKPEGNVTRAPLWVLIHSMVTIVLIFLVLTNDLHNLVFHIDPSASGWSRAYEYGFAYYIIQAACYVPLTIGFFMMLYKGRFSLRKSGVLLVLGLFGVLILYAAGYYLRVPIAWESDFTMVVGFFTMLLFETAIRSGMIPVNSKYRKLFKHSTLGMRIIDGAKQAQPAFDSASAVWYDYDTFTNALASYPDPAQQGEDTLLYAAPITGGYALWQEDITALNRLHKETEESISKLQTANAVLAEEGRIKQAAEEESEKTRLMSLMEEEIAGFTIRLQAMIEQLENAGDKPKATARITLLLCYIKRRCNLFFREKEKDTIPAGELAMYLSELAELAVYAGIKTIVSSVFNDPISVRHATILYDFYYSVMHWASWIANIHILVYFGIENGSIVLKLLPSDGADTYRMGRETMSVVIASGGVYAVTDLDGDFGLSLAFPIGGDAGD